MTVGVALAGVTGSIGTQSIEVCEAAPDRYEIAAIGASGANPDALVALAHRTRAPLVAVADAAAARDADLASRLGRGVELRCGPEALASLAAEASVAVVVNGVVGFAGLPVTMATLRAGKRLALANKESLIAAGPVVQRVRSTPGAEILPVDSEHCALHQCLRSGSDRGLDLAHLVLTASGGPFRGRSAADLAEVTVADALAHPTWSMGPKITIDSSTLMNKGLEVIEAVELFGPTHGVTIDTVQVVVHPQSIIHSMATFSDGATIAQLSMPDMRLPIGYCLAYPDRLGTAFGAIDWASLARLDFEPPDLDAFPCLRLAFEAGRAGGTRPAQLSAANEVAVEAFLAARLRWVEIPGIIAGVLDRLVGTDPNSLDDVLDADATARRTAADLLPA